MSSSSQSTRLVGRVYRISAFQRITGGSRIKYYSLMFFTAYAFEGHVHVFAAAGGVKIVSHSSCRMSAIFKYFCPLEMYIFKVLLYLHIRVFSQHSEMFKIQIKMNYPPSPQTMFVVGILFSRCLCVRPSIAFF